MRHVVAGILAGAFVSRLLCPGSTQCSSRRRAFPQDLRELPASVTVITEDDIAKSAARTLPELLSGEAGLTMKDFFGNNAASTSVDLRGFGVTGPQNTLILLDGRRLNRLRPVGRTVVGDPDRVDRAHRDPARHPARYSTAMRRRPAWSTS